MKKIKIASILLIVITLSALAYIFAYSIYGYTIAEDYAAAVIYSFGRTGTHLLPYQRLDKRFQNEISEEFYNAETVDEFLSMFEKINSIDCGPNFFQKLSVKSTDEFKQDFPKEIEDSSGRIFLFIIMLMLLRHCFFNL